MKYQMIFVVITPDDGAWFYATKYIGPSNFKGSRFKFCRINCSFEEIDRPKTVSWEHNVPGHGQQDQLQHALGNNYRVLSQYETLTACGSLTNRLRVQSNDKKA